MASLNLLQPSNLGNGLEKNTAGKLAVKVDPADGNLVTVSEAGVKVLAPAQAELPAVVNGASISGNTITLTKTSGEPVTVELPAVPVDVKLANFIVEGTTIKAVLSDNTEVTVQLTAEVIVAAIASATEDQKNSIVDALLPQLKAKLRGAEAQDFEGNHLGYFVAG